MQTPKNSQIASTNRTNTLHDMLNQLNRKINQISDLKSMISQTIYYQELNQTTRRSQKQKQKQRNKVKQQHAYQLIFNLVKYFKNDVVCNIKQQIGIISKCNMQSTINIVNFYQLELKKCRNYYQTEIWDLRQQIKRQYKVIALMKQEVEDLMILMKYKDNQSYNQDNDSQDYSRQINQNTRISRSNNQQNQQKQRVDQMQINKSSSVTNRQYATDLSIIQEQTQRTLQSSQRSQNTANDESNVQQYPAIFRQQKQQPKIIEAQNIQKRQITDKQAQKSSQQQKPSIPKFDEKQNNNIEESTNNFNQEITPKQTDRHQEQKIQLSSEHQSHNKSIFQNHNYEGIQSSNKIYYHSNQLPFSISLKQQSSLSKNKKNNKMHTAPSENRRVDHLQSIFFLDEEPEQFMNKTNQMKKIGDKFKFQSHFQNNNGNKYLQHSEVLHNNDEQYPLFDQLNKNKRQLPKSKYLSEKDQSQIFSQSSAQNMKREVDFDNIDRNGLEKSRGQPSNFNKKYNRTITNQSYEDKSQQIFKKFSKAVPICEIQSSASVPNPSNNNVFQQLSPNLDFEKNNDKSNTENKPKTKQFLEQFRKTFNKCLKSMQVSKKNSTKLSNSNSRDSIKQGKSNSLYHPESEPESHQIISGVMTFGKSNTNSGYSSVSHRQSQIPNTRNKQNYLKQREKHNEGDHHNTKQESNVKAVDHMLKQLQNNNKFVIGTKKIQLKYEGQKKNGVRNGNGLLYYSNGLCYQGQFKDGVRHGYGILKFNHIQIYNGSWVHDQIEGQGKIRNCAIINKRKTVYSNQNPLGKWISYSGEFKNSKFQGSGTLFLQGGQKFVGYFQNGHACGEGAIYKKNGQVQYNLWKNSFQVEVNRNN